MLALALAFGIPPHTSLWAITSAFFQYLFDLEIIHTEDIYFPVALDFLNDQLVSTKSLEQFCYFVIVLLAV